jgi:uncharacterized protein
MTYLIDGHNLIPKITGLSLDQLDDEVALVDLIVAFSTSHKHQVELFFDRGRVGSLRDYQRGRVHVHFVLPPMIADNAILARLLGIGRAARNYVVVTDDRNVQNRARSLGAAILSSTSFATELQNSCSSSKPIQGNKNQTQINTNEIEEWLKIFNSEHKKPENT